MSAEPFPNIPKLPLETALDRVTNSWSAVEERVAQLLENPLADKDTALGRALGHHFLHASGFIEVCLPNKPKVTRSDAFTTYRSLASIYADGLVNLGKRYDVSSDALGLTPDDPQEQTPIPQTIAEVSRSAEFPRLLIVDALASQYRTIVPAHIDALLAEAA